MEAHDLWHGMITFATKHALRVRATPNAVSDIIRRDSQRGASVQQETAPDLVARPQLVACRPTLEKATLAQPHHAPAMRTAIRAVTPDPI